MWFYKTTLHLVLLVLAVNFYIYCGVVKTSCTTLTVHFRKKTQIVFLTEKGLNLQNFEISVRRWFVREVESEGRNQWTRERRFVLFWFWLFWFESMWISQFLVSIPFNFCVVIRTFPFSVFWRACCLICFVVFCFSDIDGGKTNLKVITVYRMGFCVFTETLLLHDQDIHYYRIKDK